MHMVRMTHSQVVNTMILSNPCSQSNPNAHAWRGTNPCLAVKCSSTVQQLFEKLLARRPSQQLLKLLQCFSSSQVDSNLAQSFYTKPTWP